MTKIVTRPKGLKPSESAARDAEIKVQRIYALGDTLTLRQRRAIVQQLLMRLYFEGYREGRNATAST